MKKAWTTHELKRASEMWAGGQTASVIAQEMGRTRNAIIGMMRRVREASNGSVKKRAPKLRRAVPEARTIVVKAILPKATTSRQERADAVRLPPLGDGPIADRGCCGFITGDPWRACNRPTGGGSWCPAHRSIVFDRRVVA